MSKPDSRISGLHRRTVTERLKSLVDAGFMQPADAARLSAGQPLMVGQADKMTENVIGVFGLPLSVAPNFRINGRDVVVPMVVEEPSIVAGVSAAARLMRNGITVTSTEPLLIGQVQLLDVADPEAAIARINEAAPQILDEANAVHPNLVARGGGARSVDVIRHTLPDDSECLVVHIAVDTRDAMGANLVNTIAESLAPALESLAGGRACLRILSNLTDQSMVTATVTVELDALRSSGFDAAEVRDGIVAATNLALVDPYRATTHNKGIMNGVDAVAIATGNDWRAIEAAAHAYASKDGSYRSLSRWQVDGNGNLSGELTMPLKTGIVGGSTKANPGAAIALALTGVSTANELAEIMCAVGLAQNFAALRALVTHGIQKGHMSLHARSVVSAAGAPAEIFERVVAALINSGEIKDWKARELIDSISGSAMAALPASEVSGSGTSAGKLILLGEHAVVYGSAALAVPLPEAVVARCCEQGDGHSLYIPNWNIAAGSLEEAPEAAAAIVKEIVRQLARDHGGLRFDVDAHIPAGMGLGASAALAVAIARSVSDLLSLGLDDAAINAVAFDCEKISHGDPSGVDNTVAAFSRPILYRRGDDASKATLAADAPPILVCHGEDRGETRALVSAVRQRYDDNTPAFEAIFAQIDDLAVAAAKDLEGGDFPSLGAKMNVCQGLLNAIGVSTPDIENMVSIARNAGAIGAKLTGAGGGGSIVALCPGNEDKVAGALRDAGYRVLKR